MHGERAEFNFYIDMYNQVGLFYNHHVSQLQLEHEHSQFKSTINEASHLTRSADYTGNCFIAEQCTIRESDRDEVRDAVTGANELGRNTRKSRRHCYLEFARKLVKLFTPTEQGWVH